MLDILTHFVKKSCLSSTRQEFLLKSRLTIYLNLIIVRIIYFFNLDYHNGLMDFLQCCTLCHSHSCCRSLPRACDHWVTLEWDPKSQRLPVPSAVLGMNIFSPFTGSVLREPCVVENTLTGGKVTEPHEGFYTGIPHFAFTKDLH